MNKSPEPIVLCGMKSYFYLTALLLCCSHAQESTADPFAEQAPNANTTNEVSVPFDSDTIIQSLEYIKLPVSDVTRLLFDENLLGDSVKLRESLTKLIQEGKAHTHEMMCNAGSAGTTLTSDATIEMIYPTEYEPSRLLQTVQMPQNTKFGKEWQKLISHLQSGVTASAFEPRNVGNSFETKSTTNADRSYVQSRLAPEIVHHEGWSYYGKEVDHEGKPSVRMPIFSVLRYSATITTSVSKPQLLTIHNCVDEKGALDPSHKILVFLRSRVIPTEKSK